MNAIHARSQLRYWPTLSRGDLSLIVSESGTGAVQGWSQAEGVAAHA